MANKKVNVMIGSGEDSIFLKVNKGDRFLIGSGNNSCFIEAGVTPEEEMQKIDDKLDEIGHSKPGVMVKRLIRKFKK